MTTLRGPRFEESAVVALAAIAVAVFAIDAVREIPPLADDLYFTQMGPGGILQDTVGKKGPFFRPLGFAYVDAVNVLSGPSQPALVAAILATRALTFVATYLFLRRLMQLSPAAAILAAALSALTPAGIEGWTMLCVLNMAISIPFLAAACGQWTVAVRRLAREPRLAVGPLVLACTLQFAAYACYEQHLLAVPAFVVVLVGVAAVRGEMSVARAAAAGAWAIVPAAIFIAGMYGSGYVSSRAIATAPAAEASDFIGAVRVLWIGFAQHNLWRAVEMIRTSRFFVWDATLWGMVSAAASVGLAICVAREWHKDSEPAANDTHVTGPGRIAAAALVGAYAAMLPIGLAYPGFAFFSRMFYGPGFFVALAVAATLELTRGTRRLRGAITLVVALVVLWSAVCARRYLSDMRDGSRMLRVVGEAVGLAGSDPSSRVLVVAPEVVGTFSTSAVQPFTVRREVHRTRPEWRGGLLFAASCSAARVGQIVDDESRPIGAGANWQTVVRFDREGLKVAPTLSEACGPG